MTHIATKRLSLVIIALLFASIFYCLCNVEPVAAATTYSFIGVIDEVTGEYTTDNCTVLLYYTTPVPGGTIQSFVVNNTAHRYDFVTDYELLYVVYNFTDGTNREYWFSDSDTSGLYYIFYGDFQYYTINFLDYTGTLFNYQFIRIDVLASSYDSGYLPVEKQPVDIQNSVYVKLIEGVTYSVVLDGSDGTYIYGNLTATSATTIQLTLKGADFPKESLLKYPYVTFYGYREFDTPFGSIVLNYNDTKLQTTNLIVTITDNLGNIVYTTTLAANSSVITWPSAVNSTIYYATIEVTHGLYGDLSWSQTFANQAGDSSALFSFSFLGNWAFNTAYILPALIILFVACCFSVLNAEVGAILATVAGLVLAYIGWLPIPVGLLVSAFAFSILMAIVYNKRRGAVY